MPFVAAGSFCQIQRRIPGNDFFSVENFEYLKNTLSFNSLTRVFEFEHFSITKTTNILQTIQKGVMIIKSSSHKEIKTPKVWECL